MFRLSIKTALVSNSRMVWLDAVKGFLILCIMVSHSCGFPFNLGPYFKAGFVSAFFVLSGFTFKVNSFKDGIIKKAKTLLLPYFIYGFLCIVFLTIREFILNGMHWNYFQGKILGLFYSRYCLFPTYDCSEASNVFFLRAGIDPLWFLTCLFMAFVWVYVYFNCNKKYKVALLFVFITIPYLCRFLPILLPWSIDTSFLGAFLVILGYYFRLNICSISEKCDSIIMSPFTFAVALMILIVITNLTGEGNMSIADYGKYGGGYISFILQALLMVYLLVIVFIIVENTLFASFFAFLGRHSLRLMCIHLMVFVFTGIVDRPLGVNPLLVYIWALVSIVISVAISMLIKRIINNREFAFLKYV